MNLLNRAISPAVALETTLIVHGVPRADALKLHTDLCRAVADSGAHAATVGVVAGRPIVGLLPSEVELLLAAPTVAKVNTSNLGVILHRRQHGATTVSTTMELAARAGVRVFATGGIGGVHKGFSQHADISSDLTALTRYPVAVVTSGVKSLLDVAATREALETLGICVIGWQTDRFPAFYLRELAGVGDVDARTDSIDELAELVHQELTRTSRGVVVCNPIPSAAAIAPNQFDAWLRIAEIEAESAGAVGRQRTPAVLGALHEVSNGVTLRANLDLALSNAMLAGRLAAAMQ